MATINGTTGSDEIYGTLDFDQIFGRRGNDRLYGESGDDAVEGAAGQDVLWGDAHVFADEDGVIVGGNDRLSGGTGGDTLWGDGSVTAWRGGATIVGGDDRLSGGAGNDTLWGDGFCFEAETSVFRGGDDRLVGGAGDDYLFGDGQGHETGEFVGGSDTFVFRKGYGRDRIGDFRSADGDVIELGGTGLRWRNLDTNRNGALDDADRWVEVEDPVAFTHAGIVTIDVGRATGGARAGVDVLIVENNTSLVEGDLVFV